MRADLFPLLGVLLATSPLVGCDGGGDPEEEPTADELFMVCQDTMECLQSTCAEEGAARDAHAEIEPDPEMDPTGWESWNETLLELAEAHEACWEIACLAPATFDEVSLAGQDTACWEGEHLDMTCALGLGLNAAATDHPAWCDNIYGPEG